MNGEEKNIQVIKSLCGKYQSPSRIEKDAQSTNKIEQVSTKNIISFLYKRGIRRSLFNKVIFN